VDLRNELCRSVFFSEQESCDSLNIECIQMFFSSLSSGRGLYICLNTSYFF
jgi:hypothetical protein